MWQPIIFLLLLIAVKCRDHVFFQESWTSSRTTTTDSSQKRFPETQQRKRVRKFPVCANVSVTEALGCNLAMTRCQRKRRGSVVLTEALEAWRSSQKQSRASEQGPFYTSFPNTIVPQSGRPKHCVSSDPSLRETRNPQSDGLKEKRKLTDVV
eukprot:superscaffoldBa00005355_g20235